MIQPNRGNSGNALDVKSLGVKYLCLSCEGKPSIFSSFGQLIAKLSRFFANFSGLEPIYLAKEAPEFFDKTKAGEFTLKNRDAAFLLTVGSFLLTVDLFYLHLTILAFLLTIGAFLLTVLAFLLTIGAFCLEGDSASNT